MPVLNSRFIWFLKISLTMNLVLKIFKIWVLAHDKYLLSNKVCSPYLFSLKMLSTWTILSGHLSLFCLSFFHLFHVKVFSLNWFWLITNSKVGKINKNLDVYNSASCVFRFLKTKGVRMLQLSVPRLQLTSAISMSKIIQHVKETRLELFFGRSSWSSVNRIIKNVSTDRRYWCNEFFLLNRQFDLKQAALWIRTFSPDTNADGFYRVRKLELIVSIKVKIILRLQFYSENSILMKRRSSSAAQTNTAMASHPKKLKIDGKSGFFQT
jgi:hypothetical protein